MADDKDEKKLTKFKKWQSKTRANRLQKRNERTSKRKASQEEKIEKLEARINKESTPEFIKKNLRKKKAKLEGAINAPRMVLNLVDNHGQAMTVTSTAPVFDAEAAQQKENVKEGAKKFGKGLLAVGKGIFGLVKGVASMIFPKTTNFICEFLGKIFDVGKEFANDIKALIGDTAKTTADEKGFNLTEKNGQQVLERKDGTAVTAQDIAELNSSFEDNMKGQKIKIGGSEFTVKSVETKQASPAVQAAEQAAAPEPVAPPVPERTAEKGYKS